MQETPERMCWYSPANARSPFPWLVGVSTDQRSLVFLSKSPVFSVAATDDDETSPKVATWLSGGLTVTVITYRDPGEDVDHFKQHHNAVVAETLLRFPKDP